MEGSDKPTESRSDEGNVTTKSRGFSVLKLSHEVKEDDVSLDQIQQLCLSTAERSSSIQIEYGLKGHKNTTECATNILQAVGDLRSLLDEVQMLKKQSASQRLDGIWRPVRTILTRTLKSILDHSSEVPHIPDNEGLAALALRKIKMKTYQSLVRDLTEDIKVLLTCLPYVINSYFGTIDSTAVEKELKDRYFFPFWYSHRQDLVHFREGINLLKTTVAGSYKRDNFITRNISAAFSAAESALKTLHSPRDATKRGDQIIRDEVNRDPQSALKLMDSMWNLPESGIPSLAISVAKPSIKESVIVKVLVAKADPIQPECTFDSVECVLVSNSTLPVIIPSSKEVDAYNPLPKTPLPKGAKPSIRGDPVNADGRHIIFDIHGGGFVSGSSHTHELYLRPWAKDTNSVLVGINYTISPEAKFPQALYECFYVYKQIVQNKLLGCEPVSIVVCGDSAGGNLAMSMCLLAIKHGVRLPDGIVLAYPAIDLSRTATPSRIMFAHDVLLSYHLLDTCLKAYLGEKENEAGSNKLISPLLASDDELRALPDKICILSATYDPLLDDATRFIRRLKAIEKPLKYYIYEMPHGFLNFAALLPGATAPIRDSTDFINSIFSETVNKPAPSLDHDSVN